MKAKGKKTVASYPLQIRVINSYLVIVSPEWNIQISAGSFLSNPLDESAIHVDSIGRAVLKVLIEVQRKLDEYQSQGKSLPCPQRGIPSEINFQNRGNLMTIKEAASFLKISQGTLRRLSSKRIFKVKNTPGGHRRYSLQELENFIELQNNRKGS